MVRQADGDLAAPARRARMEYTSALKLLARPGRPWNPKVRWIGWRACSRAGRGRRRGIGESGMEGVLWLSWLSAHCGSCLGFSRLMVVVVTIVLDGSGKGQANEEQ